MLVRELPPLRQSLLVTAPNGRTYRWSEDEPDPANVMKSLKYSSTMPGGFENFGCVLPRKPEHDYADLVALSDIQVLGPGCGIDGEYRLEAVPKQSGDEMAVSPEAVGWQANLADDQSATMIYVDRDLGRWTTMSRSSRVGGWASFTVEDPNVEADIVSAGLPSLRLTNTGPWAAANRPAAQATYDAGKGNKIADAYYDWVLSNSTGGSNLVNIWSDEDSDDIAGSDQRILNNSGVATRATYQPPSAARRYYFISLSETAGAACAVDNSIALLALRSLAVYGNHGLTKRGAAPGGFYAADAVAHAVGRWAPKLKYTTGLYGTIQQSSFVIPQLAFPDLTTADAMVKEMTKYELLDWAVWERRTFYLNARNARGRKWRARVGPARLRGTGQQVDAMWNSVIVQYQDVDGSQRTVGPTGSNADATSALLVDSDPLSPLNQAGVARRCLLKMGVTTAAGAIQVGARFLEQSRFINTSGQATLTGHVMDDKGRLHPYFSVRAGDQISFTDAADTSYRRIVRADVDRPAREVSIDLDAPPQALQALLERLSVVIQPLGFS